MQPTVKTGSDWLRYTLPKSYQGLFAKTSDKRSPDKGVAERNASRRQPPTTNSYDENTCFDTNLWAGVQCDTLISDPNCITLSDETDYPDSFVFYWPNENVFSPTTSTTLTSFMPHDSSGQSTDSCPELSPSFTHMPWPLIPSDGIDYKDPSVVSHDDLCQQLESGSLLSQPEFLPDKKEATSCQFGSCVNDDPLVKSRYDSQLQFNHQPTSNLPPARKQISPIRQPMPLHGNDKKRTHEHDSKATTERRKKTKLNESN